MNHVGCTKNQYKKTEQLIFFLDQIENCSTHPYWIKNGYVKYQNRRHGGYAEYSVNTREKFFFMIDTNNRLFSVEMVIN